MRNDLLKSCLSYLLVDDHLRMTEHNTKESWYNSGCPQNTPFWAMCSMNRASMLDSLGFSQGTKKKTFTPFTLMKMLHL